MPEFYDNGECRLMLRAQPYLAAIARGVRDEATSRAFLLKGTHYAQAYAGAEPLWRDQWKERDEYDLMKCPFWSNYFYPTPCQSCDCRINKARMEIDAMFFLRNAKGKKLAIHIEMKCDGEPLKIGQAEAYRPRAVCFQEERRDEGTRRSSATKRMARARA
jgi:hypothetical protein